MYSTPAQLKYNSLSDTAGLFEKVSGAEDRYKFTDRRVGDYAVYYAGIF